MHFRQLMTLDISNDMLLCEVFLASLHGLALSKSHRLLYNSINSFRDVFEASISHYVCSMHQEHNISTLRNVKM